MNPMNDSKGSQMKTQDMPFPYVTSSEFVDIFKEESDRIVDAVDTASLSQDQREQLLTQAKQATRKRVSELNAQREADARTAAWAKFDEAEAARLASFERLDAAAAAHVEAHAEAAKAAAVAKAAFPGDAS